MKSMICAFYIVILQLLWVCHSVYERLFLTNEEKRIKSSEVKPTQPPLKKENGSVIHLFTCPDEAGKLTCYIDVTEIISPAEEEMLRYACAKGFTGKITAPTIQSKNPELPDKIISREELTNMWLKSYLTS